MEGDSSSAAGAGVEQFQDWELLQNSESDLINGVGNRKNNFEEIEGDYSEGMIRADYFSIDNESRYVKTSVFVSEEGSVESDNPSWIDPGSETRYQGKNLGEFWSDSGSDRSDERKFGDFDGRNELGFVQGIRESGVSSGNFMKFGEVGFDESAKGQEGFEGIGEIQNQDKDLDRVWSDSGVDDLFSEGANGLMEENSNVAIEEMRAEVKSAGDEEKKQVAWWKVPLEVLKYCVLKVNPVWSFSMAAAVIGLVILGRKLHKMKQKRRSLLLKVTLDDKKVSQFMSRAARLNEAFSVVRRVPIVRPALPVPGPNPWPVISLR